MTKLMCFLVLSSYSFAATLINGAGATFPYPLYSKWFSEYQKVDADTQINYQSIGSGGGIRQLTEKTVDFGASDAPMTDEQLAKAGGAIVHIPTVLGAVVVTYNLPGVSEIKLTPEIVSDIFLGKITKWNDTKIAKLNPNAKLPTDSLVVVHRSDGSGTSAIFTDYLSKVSATWKEKVGTGTAVNWPVGLGGKGNEGVSGLVKQTPGTIGYVELVYAEKNALPYASLQNSSGQFVKPTVKAVTQAAAGALKDLPSDFRVSITNASGKEAYPIAGFTYLLVYKNIPADKGGKLVKFLKWSMKEGQAMAEPLFYAPLPKAMIERVQAKIATIEVAKVN